MFQQSPSINIHNKYVMVIFQSAKLNVLLRKSIKSLIQSLTLTVNNTVKAIIGLTDGVMFRTN